MADAAPAPSPLAATPTYNKIKLTQPLPVPREDLQKILDSPIPWDGENEEERTKALVAKLSADELELAAHGSYAYWLATLSASKPTDEERVKMATREARRFVHGNPDEKAEKLCKETCNYRVEHRVDLVRTCFLEGVEYEGEEDKTKAELFKTQISNDMPKQPMFCRGRDKEGRMLMIIYSRIGKGTVDEEYIASQIYIMERAIASTEFASLGVEEKITVVFELARFKSSLAPSWASLKAVANILQNYYSERLKKLIIIDPPLWARTTFGLLKPFLDPVTRAKFVVATGDKKKQQLVSEVIDEDQAMTFLMPTGKLTDEVDVVVFTTKNPFHLGYFAVDAVAAA